MKPPKSKISTSATGAGVDLTAKSTSPTTSCCVFCNSTFPLRPGSDAALITDPEDLRRIARHLVQQFDIERCELVLGNNEPPNWTTPFCPSCTKLVKKIDQMCCEVDKLKKEIGLKRDILIESAVNTFVFADVNGPYFRVKYDLFGRWSRVIQGDGLQELAPAAAAAPALRENGSQNGHSAGEESRSKSITPEPPPAPVAPAPVAPAPKPKPVVRVPAPVATTTQTKKPFVGPASKKRKYEESKEEAAAAPSQGPVPEKRPARPPPAPEPQSEVEDQDHHDFQDDVSKTSETDPTDEGKAVATPTPTKGKARAHQSPGGLTEKQKLGTLASMMFKNLKNKHKTDHDQHHEKVKPPKLQSTPENLKPKAQKEGRAGPASKKRAPALEPRMAELTPSKSQQSASKQKTATAKEPQPQPPLATKKVVLVGSSDSESETSDEECRICHKICRSKEIKRKHMKSHGGGPERHSCSRCRKTFYAPGALRKHMAHVHGEKVESPAKVKTPAKKSQLQRANSNAESEGSHEGVLRLDFGAQPTTGPSSPKQQQQNRFSCPACKISFHQRIRLRKHMRTVHRLKPKATTTAAQTTSGNTNTTAKHSRGSGSNSTKEPVAIQPVDAKLMSHAVPVVNRAEVAAYFESKTQRPGQPVTGSDSSGEEQDHKEEPSTATHPPPASVHKEKESEALTEPKPIVVKKPRPAPASIQRKREAEAAQSQASKPKPKAPVGEPEPSTGSTSNTSAVQVSRSSAPETMDTASYWSDPTAILATLSAAPPLSGSSSSLLIDHQAPAVKRLPLQPKTTAVATPSQQLVKRRRKTTPVKGKQPPSQIQIMKAKLAKSLGVAARKSVTGVPASATASYFDPAASSIALGPGRASLPVPGVRSAWGAPSTGAPLWLNSGSLGEPPVYVGQPATGGAGKSTATANAQEDEDFDPTMFVEVGTEHPEPTTATAPPKRKRAPVKIPRPGSRLPPGLKIVDLQNIIGGNVASNQLSSPAAVAAPPEPEEESPIKICNIRSLCSADPNEDGAEVIDLESEEPQPTASGGAIVPMIPALSLAGRALPSPRRRSIAPKVHSGGVHIYVPQPPPRGESLAGPTRVREVLLPPAQPYKRKKGPTPRARVATVTDTTTFKPSSAGGGGHSQGHSSGADAFPFDATF